MSLLANLLHDISKNGSILEKELKTDKPNLFVPKPWHSYDVELPPRAAWEASQNIIADCGALISLLTPTKIKLLTECSYNWVTVALGVACDMQIADKIIEKGGEATLQHLAKVCNTDEHKLGKCFLYPTHIKAAPSEFLPIVNSLLKLRQMFSEIIGTVTS
jgi:hypothetical protein